MHLCATGGRAKNGEPIGKVLGITTTSRLLRMKLNKEFGVCRCQTSHAGFHSVNWTETAYYTDRLGESLVRGALQALKQEAQ